MKPKTYLNGAKKKTLSLSISMILAASVMALAGCSDDNEPVADAGQGGGGQGGGSGGDQGDRGGVICLDTNINAVCDAGEPSEVVNTWSNAAVATRLNGASAPLAYSDNDGRTLTAPAGSGEVSPATTLLNNELVYNQLIAQKTTTSAQTYLNGIFGGELSGASQLDFAAAIKDAVSDHPDVSRYAVIAAVTNKAVSLGQAGLAEIKNITVSAEDIAEADYPSLEALSLAESLSFNVDDKIEQQEADGWIHAKDSNISVISAKNGKIIGGSHYHNALTVIDVSAGTSAYSPVSAITDSGHGVDSASGASENYLRDAVLNHDASAVYVNIAPKKLTSESADVDTYGLYKAAIESDGSIKTVVDGTSISIDESVSTRIVTKISNFVVSNDSSKVVTYNSSDKTVSVYDGDLNPVGTPQAIEDIKVVAVSSDTVYIIRENAADDTKADVVKLAADTLAETGNFTLGFTPDEIVLSEDGTQLVAFNHGHDYNGKMTIAVVQLSDNSVETGWVKITSDTGAVSPDFKTLAAVGHEENRVLIINLTVPGFSVQSAHELAYNARDVAFLSNSQIALTNERNSIGILDISSTGENINLDAKSDLALQGINHATVNGGGFFSAVVSDVTLTGSYENVSISWSESGLTGSLDATSGAVTRPDNAATDVSGSLHAATTASFRGETVEGSKDIELTIRKEPAVLPEAKIVQTADNSSQYMEANHDGSIMVAPVRFENANEENVYGFISLKVGADGQPVIGSGTADTPKTYSDTESLVGVGINGFYAIGVSDSVGESGQARIFSVNINADAVMADTVTGSVDITSGSPLKVSYNAAKNSAAVMIKKEDESYVTEIYALDDNGAISLSNTIAMEPAEYKSYGPPAINEDATRVYQRDGDNVIMTATDGTTATVAVDEVARVWFYDGHVFVNTYEGNIISFSDSLDESSRQLFSTGTGGRMYGAAGASVNGKSYLFVPVQRASNDAMNGVYQLEVQADGSLKEVAFSKKEEGADRMTVSGDGSAVFYSYRVRKGDDKGRWFGVVQIPAE